jgi:hypothetical protein
MRTRDSPQARPWCRVGAERRTLARPAASLTPGLCNLGLTSMHYCLQGTNANNPSQLVVTEHAAKLRWFQALISAQFNLEIQRSLYQEPRRTASQMVAFVSHWQFSPASPVRVRMLHRMRRLFSGFVGRLKHTYMKGADPLEDAGQCGGPPTGLIWRPLVWSAEGRYLARYAARSRAAPR